MEPDARTKRRIAVLSEEMDIIHRAIAFIGGKRPPDSHRRISIRQERLEKIRIELAQRDLTYPDQGFLTTA